MARVHEARLPAYTARSSNNSIFLHPNTHICYPFVKVCPVCVICRESFFGGEWFKCTNGECRYEAPRDLKSAPCILLKYLKGLRERSGDGR